MARRAALAGLLFHADSEDAEAAFQALLQRGVAAGHVDALYEHVDVLQAALTGLVPAITSVPRP
jgi:hypothetical protein